MRTRAWLAVPVMIFLLMAVAIPWEMLCIGAVSAFCVLVQWGCEASGVTKRLDELSQPLLTWIDALDNSRAMRFWSECLPLRMATCIVLVCAAAYVASMISLPIACQKPAVGLT